MPTTKLHQAFDLLLGTVSPQLAAPARRAGITILSSDADEPPRRVRPPGEGELLPKKTSSGRGGWPKGKPRSRPTNGWVRPMAPAEPVERGTPSPNERERLNFPAEDGRARNSGVPVRVMQAAIDDAKLAAGVADRLRGFLAR